MRRSESATTRDAASMWRAASALVAALCRVARTDVSAHSSAALALPLMASVDTESASTAAAMLAIDVDCD